MNRICPAFNIKINSPFKKTRKRKFQFRDKFLEDDSEIDVARFVETSPLRGEREYARREENGVERSRTTFEKARENAVILREFHERVGKHDRGVKVKEEWKRVLP